MSMTKEQTESVRELRELARATRAYIIQNSRSVRRKQAMLEDADITLAHAQEAFGDENG